MIKTSYPYTQADLDNWKTRLGRRRFDGDAEFFNRLCVMFQCTDTESIEEAGEKIMLSLKFMGED